MELYGPSVTPGDSRFYSIELTVRMPQKSKYSQSTVKLGHHKYGFYLPPVQWSVTDTISPGECKTIKAEVDLSQDFSRFVPMTAISGEVEFENLSIKKHPDALATAGMTVVEGTLTELSAIPDPKKSDYPDCRFVCRFTGNSIIAGNPCPREFAAVLEGFINYKYKDTKNLKPGDKVRMLVIPFNKLPDRKKSTQQADDLDLFMLDNYYVAGLNTVYSFNDWSEMPESGIRFIGDEYISVFKQQVNPKLPDELQKMQAQTIASDLAKINEFFSGYDKNKISEINQKFYDAWQQEQAKDKNGRNRINNRVWRNMDNSFWCLPQSHKLIPEIKLLSKHNLEAIVEFKNFLELNGCQFIIAVTPNFYDIAARVINKDFRHIPDFQSAKIVRQLLERGVETIYYSDELIKNYNRYPWAFFFPGNEHPSDTTQDVLADVLAARLSRFNFPQTLAPEKFSFSRESHFYGDADGYQWRENCDIGNNIPGTSYKCRRVRYDGKDIKYDPDSPVLILGNSFIQTPMSYPESLPTLLISKLRHNVSVFRSDSFGPLVRIIPSIFKSPKHYLQNKKVVIMVLGTDHFYSGVDFVNIRELDAKMSMLNGKKLVKKFFVPSNILKKENGNWISTGKQGKIKLLDISSPVWDTDKELIVSLQTYHPDKFKRAFYKINRVDKIIPHNMGHDSVIHKLSAGTKELTIELITSKPDAVLSIQSISIHQ